VQHAKRTQNLAHLPPYQTETVRTVTREVRDLNKDVAELLEPFQGSFDPSADPAVACTLLVNHLSMRRNKRCLLAYHRTRTDKLEELVWKGADVVDLSGQQVRDGAASGSGSGSSSSLSPQEEEYVRQYSDLLAAYKGQWTDVDLTGSLEPPRDLFIDVRVLKDAGEIQTEYGYGGTLHSVSGLLVANGDIQGNQFDQEQSVLCQAGGCRETDRPGLLAEAELRDSIPALVPYARQRVHPQSCLRFITMFMLPTIYGRHFTGSAR
jgi:GINS complex subunit 1